MFADYFSIIILGIFWIASFPAFRRGGRYTLGALISAVIGIILIASYTTYAQYGLWQGDEVSRYFLPPHAPISYFIYYAFTEFWAPHVISGIMAFAVFWAAYILNKKFQGQFFEREEIFFIATGMFLSGHPGWIAYMALICIFYFLFSLMHVFWFRASRRISFYYSWLPLAVLVISLNSFLLNYNWYGNLVI